MAQFGIRATVLGGSIKQYGVRGPIATSVAGPDPGGGGTGAGLGSYVYRKTPTGLYRKHPTFVYRKSPRG